MACSSCQKIKASLSNIVEGNFKRVVKTEESEKLADVRRKICEGCDEKRKLIKVNQKQRYYCDLCKCPIESKIRAKDETCPLKKW